MLVFLLADSAYTNLLSDNLTHATASLVHATSVTPGPVTALVNFSITTVYCFQRVCAWEYFILLSFGQMGQLGVQFH